MAKLEWNQSFDLGIRQIDKQHRKLMDLINAVHDGFAAAKPREEINKILTALSEYTHKHFAEEEALMLSSGYKDLRRHQMQHQQIRDQLRDYIEAYHGNDETVGPKLLTFLQTWLAAHVQGVDQKIAPFLSK